MYRIKKALKYGACTAILIGLFVRFTRKNEMDTDKDASSDNSFLVPSIFLEEKTKYFYNFECPRLD